MISHAVNAALSLRLLLKTAGIRVRPHVPMLTALTMASAVLGASGATNWAVRLLIFGAVLTAGLFGLEILRGEDIRWLRGLIKNEKNREKLKNNV